ncbi:unnamed protein product [Microthlaspi erraticum]|uniref:Uncharacterized protein n=1 Tax=Microthlaspi erraticum TaxID=1685480 RepID=A0A6D2HVY0_9BRAS|nr:unnamed protein product [Microthlaspi erraticum]CAA7053086.1 unnamed protein product [Microthlaspi erraticum]
MLVTGFNPNRTVLGSLSSLWGSSRDPVLEKQKRGRDSKLSQTSTQGKLRNETTEAGEVSERRGFIGKEAKAPEKIQKIQKPAAGRGFQKRGCGGGAAGLWKQESGCGGADTRGKELMLIGNRAWERNSFSKDGN